MRLQLPKETHWRSFVWLIFTILTTYVGFAYSWAAALLCLWVSFVFSFTTVFFPRCQWLCPVHCKTHQNTILITIDDGPDPTSTPVLLDLLDQYKTKAIFFMIGEKVLTHPELAREVIRRGHEIGNHTHTHPRSTFWAAGPIRTHREIANCQSAVEMVTNTKPRWFRAPVGHRNFFTYSVAQSLGLQIMAWSQRGFDAVNNDAKQVLERILPDLAYEDIVLIHDTTPIAAEVLAGLLSHMEALAKTVNK